MVKKDDDVAEDILSEKTVEITGTVAEVIGRTFEMKDVQFKTTFRFDKWVAETLEGEQVTVKGKIDIVGSDYVTIGFCEFISSPVKNPVLSSEELFQEQQRELEERQKELDSDRQR